MLLVQKTPSSVSKVTSVIFRANQEGFNEKPLSCNCLGFKSIQPLYVSVMPLTQDSTQLNHLLKSNNKIQMAKKKSFSSQQNMVHTHLHISASAFRYVHIYLYISHKITWFLHVLVFNMFSL